MNEQTIIRRERGKENPYFLMARDIPQNKALSYEAVGMAAYFLSKPDDWQIIVGDLIRDGVAGRDKVYRILRELRVTGYLHREEKRNERGRFEYGDYIFTELPLPEKPHTDEPHTDEPHTENPTLHKRDSTEGEKQQRRDEQGSAPNGARRTREPDAIFDAVKAHIFGIDPEENAEGGRIGKISNWLKGKYEGKGSARVGFISKSAEAHHVEKFAAWCVEEGFTPPLDLVKFVEQWRRWASTVNATSQKPAPQRQRARGLELE